MPSASTNKRPGDDAADDDRDTPQAKHPRTDLHQHNHDDFIGGVPATGYASSSSKKKSAGSSRTGQACDRCKVSETLHYISVHLKADSRGVKDPQD